MVKDLNMAIRSGDNSGSFPASARLFHQEFPVQKSQAPVLCLRHLDLIFLAKLQLIKPLPHGLNVQWKDLLKQKTFSPRRDEKYFCATGWHARAVVSPFSFASQGFPWFAKFLIVTALFNN